MYPWWAGALIDLAFIAAVALFAINYNFIWYDILQKNEPFTREFARMAQKRPWLFYGICVALLVGAFWGAVAITPWYFRVIHIIIVGFFGWFIPHVAEYAHDPNNPPHLPDWFAWAAPKRECRRKGL